MRKEEGQNYVKANVKHKFTQIMSFISDSSYENYIQKNRFAINGGFLHSGTDGNNGHYTTIIRLKGNSWVEYNDDVVTNLSYDEAKERLEKNGVTLIYKRIDEIYIERRGKIKTKSENLESQIPSKTNLTPKNSPKKPNDIPTQKKDSQPTLGGKDGRHTKFRQTTIAFEKRQKN